MENFLQFLVENEITLQFRKSSTIPDEAIMMMTNANRTKMAHVPISNHNVDRATDQDLITLIEHACYHFEYGSGSNTSSGKG